MIDRTDESLLSRFWDKVRKSNVCWIWEGARVGAGYGSFRVGGRKGKSLLAHRVSYVIEHGDIPDGCLVCHRCDNPACVRPEHLFAGSHKDNSQDMERKGRTGRCYGKRNGKATFTFEQAEEVRGLRREGMTYRALASRFGIANKTVYDILRRRIWTRRE